MASVLALLFLITVCFQTRFRDFLEIICRSVLFFLITISIRMVPVEKRIKVARVARTVFQFLLTHYRLSRISFFLIFNFIYGKLVMRNYIQKQQFEEQETTSKWSEPPEDDVMQMVLQKIYLTDFFQCRTVGHSWKASIDRAIASNFCHPLPELPWLMLFSHPSSTKDNCVMTLTYNEKLVPKASPTYNMNRGDCVGSIEGWLIMADSALWRPEGFMKPWSFYLYNHESSSFSIHYFFLNPITGARVMLPSTKNTLPCHCPNEPYFCLEVAASSVPTNQHRCFVVSLCESGHLAFCRPSDESWTFIDQTDFRGQPIIHDIEIIDGKIYAAAWDADRFLTVFDIQYGNGTPPSYTAEKLVMFQPGPITDRFSYVRTIDGVVYHTNRDLISLVKDSLSGELFMIFCTISFAMTEDRTFQWSVFGGGNFVEPVNVQSFRVFKMEWKINVPQWVEVFDLGDRILFVTMAGCNKIISVSNGLDYNGITDEAFKRNCIYFAYDTQCFESPSMGRDVGLFSLTDRKIRRIKYANERSLSRLYHKHVWFTPNPW